MSRLGALFKAKRELLNLRVSDLARRAGYRNISNGSFQIRRLEQHGIAHGDLLNKLAALLDISSTSYIPLLRSDKRDRLRAWLKRNSTHPHYYVIFRPRSGARCELPDWIVTAAQAETFVADVAKEIGLPCLLYCSSRIQVMFAADGRIDFVIEAPTPE